MLSLHSLLLLGTIRKQFEFMSLSQAQKMSLVTESRVSEQKVHITFLREGSAVKKHFSFSAKWSSAGDNRSLDSAIRK